MSGFIDFAGVVDAPAEWVLCGWSDRAADLRWQSAATSITLRGGRSEIPAEICAFQRADIGTGAGLLVHFALSGRGLPADPWTRLGRVALRCDGERLELAQADGAQVLPNEDLKRRLRDVLPHAAASRLRGHLLRFAFARDATGTIAGGARSDPADTSEDQDFIARLVRSRSPLLNQRWLAARYGIPDLVLDDHEVATAILSGLQDAPQFTTTPLFDPAWYRRQVHPADAPRSFFALLRHYLSAGESCGFSPNAFFPLARYVSGTAASHPLATGASYLETYVRSAVPGELTRHLFFDWQNYDLGGIAEERSAAAAGLDRFSHYVMFGHGENRRPNPLFDETWYVDNHRAVADLIAAGRYPNGFSHFIHEGERLGLSPNEFFNPDDYLRINQDVRRAVEAGSCQSAFWHYWTNGCVEQRVTSRDPIRGNVLTHFGTRVPWSDPAAMQAIRSCAMQSGSAEDGAVPDNPVLPETFRQLSNPIIKVREYEPPIVYSGESGTIYVGGIAVLPFARLDSITTEFGGAVVAGEFFQLPRADSIDGTLLPLSAGHALDVGFFAAFRVDAGHTAPGLHKLRLKFGFSHQGATKEFSGPELPLRIAAPVMRSALRSTVQVCMATYRPLEDDLARQVASILTQRPTAPDIVISDDATPLGERVAIARTHGASEQVALRTNELNVGFVANFERAIRGHSSAAEYILLSDQDDKWEPRKVATLRRTLQRSSAVCAFSDMAIVDRDLKELAPSFWIDRKMHCTSAVGLAVANAVTGAATMLRAGFADRLVPFPRFVGIFHDQWLSVAAAACGKIDYVDQPLYRYVQHAANVLGFGGSRKSDALLWRTVARALYPLRRRPPSAWTDRECDLFLMAVGQCSGNLMQRYVLLREALARFPMWSDPAEWEFATGLCNLITGVGSVSIPELVRSWHAMRHRVGGDLALLGIDYALKAGLTALVLVRTLAGGLGKRIAARAVRRTSVRHAFQALADDPGVTPLERKIAPIPIETGRGADRGLRVNLLVPELRLEVFFGGYYSKFSLLRRLRECGIAARVLLLDQPNVDQDQILRIANAYPQLADSLLDAEIIALGNRTDAVDFGCRDVTLATTWWSAHVAEAIRRQLGRSRFLYLIQEFEPFTFPLGTWYRAAEQSYEFPHVPLFSTGVLRDYFKSIRSSVFARKQQDVRVGTDYLVFDNPIVARGEAADDAGGARRNLLLFYARPQSHAARNMYDFGVTALRLVAERLGREAREWDFVGMGSDEPGTIDLFAGIKLTLMAKTSHAEYLRLLNQAKVGLALMYTPHPSLVPLEMAAAGLQTVTNACLTKDAASFKGVSDNITVAAPDAKSIADALLQAIRTTRRANWRPRRDVEWPFTPAQAFPDRWMARLARLAEATLQTAGGWK